jgi:hypothetical protein
VLQAQSKDARGLERKWRLAISDSEVLKHKLASDTMRHSQEINSQKRELAAANARLADCAAVFAEKNAEVRHPMLRHPFLRHILMQFSAVYILLSCMSPVCGRRGTLWDVGAANGTHSCVSKRRLGIDEKHSMRSRGKLDTIEFGLTQHQTQPPCLAHTVCTRCPSGTWYYSRVLLYERPEVQ